MLLKSAFLALAAGNLITLSFSVDSNSSYVAEIEVGTPRQSLNVSLDFASADLALLDSTQCTDTTCDGYYNISDSESVVPSSYFLDSIIYADGSLLSGYLVSDVVELGTVTLNDTVIVVRNASGLSQRNVNIGYSTFPIANRHTLGLGPRGAQAGVLWIEDDGTPGPLYGGIWKSIPDTPHSFSIWVDPDTYSYGRLTLGGLDESLYNASSVNVVPILNYANEFLVDMQNVSALREPLYLGIYVNALTLAAASATGETVTDVISNSTWTAIFDSRFKFAVPWYIMRAIANSLAMKWDYKYSCFVTRCDLEATIGLQVSNFTLEIPLNPLLVPVDIQDGTGAQVCYLNIEVAETIYLPNSVLKNWFIAVDYETNEIMFAEPLPATAAADYASINATFPQTLASSVPASALWMEENTNTSTLSLTASFAVTPLNVGASASSFYGLIAPSTTAATTSQ